MKSNKEAVYECINKCTNATAGERINGVSTQYLSDKLGMQRTNVSSILSALVKEKRIEKTKGRPVLYRIPNVLSENNEEVSCFKKLIGHNGSLKNAVQLAKAAILYPNHSLHTLILGAGGTGKSYFASLMYEFAIENDVIPENAPYVKFNCRNYDSNEEMINQLFGGNSNEECAIKEAEKGILFIDHVDLLPANGRKTLFALLESENTTEVNVTIICAANDTISTTIKEAYQGKFSIKIDLPSLQPRKMEERLALMQYFFANEALKVNRIIKVNSELLRCILLYHCDYNVKQLKTDIKIGCANAYVREFQLEANTLYVYLNDFPSYIRKGFLFYKEYRDEIETLIPRDFSYTFSGENMEKEKERAAVDSVAETIYDIIDRKANELRVRGIMEEDIHTIVSADIESDLSTFTENLTNTNINIESLAKIVDGRIITMVESFLSNAAGKFGRAYPTSIFYGLCLHLSSTLERFNKVQRLSNAKIMEIVEEYKEEYTYCMKFASDIEKTFDIQLPIDEIVFITMFICDKSILARSNKKPVILIAMHGQSTASSIAEVVNSLSKCNNTFAYDLSLKKDTKQAYEELKDYIRDIDEGQGILMICDMGSLKNMGEMIMQDTGIKIRMIEIPTTLIALDCSRRANTYASLDQIYDSVIESYRQPFTFVKDNYRYQSDNSVIITLCMSGKGGAIQMKQYLEKYLPMESVDIIPYAINDRKHLLGEVNKNLIKDYHRIRN